MRSADRHVRSVLGRESSHASTQGPSRGGSRRWLVLGCIVTVWGGCVSDEVRSPDEIGAYQKLLEGRGPQSRADTGAEDSSNPLGLLQPASDPLVEQLDPIEIVEDPNTGRKISRLSIEQAIVRALAGSPEIRVVSFDPAIAKEEITAAAADFDPTAFTRYDFDDGDKPQNSVFQPGESDVRVFETGVGQRATTGAEWSFSYALTRSWDDLVGRTFPKRYEPILALEIRQPLLRDAWEQVNLSGVDIAKLNHAISLWRFRQRAEDISTQVITAYWSLLQARHELQIQETLFEQTQETLQKVQGRAEIDATAVQVKQAEASTRSREAFVVRARKRVADVQEALLRYMADSQVNLLTDTVVVPTTIPHIEAKPLDTDQTLATAMRNNPMVRQAWIAKEIADINIDVAENQHMPRLDLVASASGTGIGEDSRLAHDSLEHDDYVSFGVGVVLEYPLGNRQRAAELQKRKLEQRKAVSSLHNTSDQVAQQVKEKTRKLEASYAEIEIQREAAQAAAFHLQALEDSEEVRVQLTPEFLLVKLQAQQSLAEARRAEVRAIAEYNTAIAELAQAAGTVLQLHRVEQALTEITTVEAPPAQTQE